MKKWRAKWKRCLVMVLWLFLYCHHDANIWGLVQNISNTHGQIDRQFSPVIYILSASAVLLLLPFSSSKQVDIIPQHVNTLHKALLCISTAVSMTVDSWLCRFILPGLSYNCLKIMRQCTSHAKRMRRSLNYSVRHWPLPEMISFNSTGYDFWMMSNVC